MKFLKISIICSFILLLGGTGGKAGVTGKVKETELKVMTWNIWGRLNQNPRYTIDGKSGRDRVIDILKESEADIITMTETYGSAKDIAESLGFHYYTPSPDANLTIFSRYPMVSSGNLENLSPFSFIEATVELPTGDYVKVYNIWLTSGRASYCCGKG